MHTSNFQNNQLDDTIKSIESDFKEDGKLWNDDIIKLILRHTVENMTFLFQDLPKIEDYQKIIITFLDDNDAIDNTEDNFIESIDDNVKTL